MYQGRFPRAAERAGYQFSSTRMFGKCSQELGTSDAITKVFGSLGRSLKRSDWGIVMGRAPRSALSVFTLVLLVRNDRGASSCRRQQPPRGWWRGRD